MEEPASIPELLAILATLADARKHQSDYMFIIVSSLRRRGVSWDEIAEALGVTRQAASAKHRSEQRRRDRM